MPTWRAHFSIEIDFDSVSAGSEFTLDVRIKHNVYKYVSTEIGDYKMM